MEVGGFYLDTVMEEIKNQQLVAILRGESIDCLENTADSLYKGGIRILEITMNTPGVLKGIERLKRLNPNMIIGAGTVLDPESAKLAIFSGADFLLAPTLNKKTISMANRYNIPIIPGVLTPTEALRAYEYGVKMIKIFPVCELGSNYISDLKGPMPFLDIMSVGGICLKNVKDYLSAGSCSLGIGSSLVDNNLIKSRNFLEIEKRAKTFVEIADQFKTSNKKSRDKV